MLEWLRKHVKKIDISVVGIEFRELPAAPPEPPATPIQPVSPSPPPPALMQATPGHTPHGPPDTWGDVRPGDKFVDGGKVWTVAGVKPKGSKVEVTYKETEDYNLEKASSPFPEEYKATWTAGDTPAPKLGDVPPPPLLSSVVPAVGPSIVSPAVVIQPATDGTGYWYVNVGENEYRNWDDCVTYGFLAAGWGREFTDQLTRLSLGDQVFAYLKGRGYVGYGEVVRVACRVTEFTPAGQVTPLLLLPLRAPDMGHTPNDPSQCEWVVGIRWFLTFPREQAKTFRGVFANPNIVCRLRNEQTLDFLRREFNVPN